MMNAVDTPLGMMCLLLVTMATLSIRYLLKTHPARTIAISGCNLSHIEPSPRRLLKAILINRGLGFKPGARKVCHTHGLQDHGPAKVAQLPTGGKRRRGGESTLLKINYEK